MILTVTPNAAVDKTYRIASFALDRVNRPSLIHTIAGGKGINVARVYQTLGGRAVATGFLGGTQGEIVGKALDAERIERAFARVAGETRLCIAIIDPEAESQTEINEPGPEIFQRNADELFDLVQSLLSQRKFEFVVLSGSLPPGAPDNLYASLIDIVAVHGIRTVLDSSGSPLRRGLEAKPWMAKLNRFEMETALDKVLPTGESLLEAAIQLRKTGISVVIATNGANGAYLVSEKQILVGVVAKVPIASAVASGDAFLGAFLQSLSPESQAKDYDNAFKLALGAGAANAAVIGAGLCSQESILQWADRCEVKRIA